MFEIYFFTILAWVLLIVGLKLLKDYAITTISSFMLMSIGICMILLNGLLMFSVGTCHIALGFYFLIRSSVEINKEPMSRIRLNFKKQNGKENNRNKRRS